MDVPMVYYKPGCPFGIRLRAALTLRRIDHVAVRLRDDEEGAARVREANGGLEISPTVHVGGVWLGNPRWDEVARASGRRRPGATGAGGSPAARRPDAGAARTPRRRR